MDEERVEWLVIGPDGTPLGHVQLSADARLAHISLDDLVTVEPDELSVPWVVRYRVAGPTRR